MVEPAQNWSFGKPATGTPVSSEEVRNNLDALAVMFFTEDSVYPEIKRDGMPRVNAEDPNNVKFQFWYDNAYRTMFQMLQLGTPAPAKTEARYDPAPPGAAWTIDHNLGSKPLVQVFDLSGNALQEVNLSPAPRDVIPMQFVPQGLLTSLAAPTTLSEWTATFAGAIDEIVLEVSEAITGPPNMVFDATINGTPITGGQVTLNAVHPTGTRLSGGAPTAANIFAVGDAVRFLVAPTAPAAAGSLFAYLDVERRLQTGQYLLQHAIDNRVVITHPAPTAGFAIILG